MLQDEDSVCLSVFLTVSFEDSICKYPSFGFSICRHFQETQHTYSLELGTQRVWDYTGGTAIQVFAVILYTLFSIAVNFKEPIVGRS